jgi:peptidylprolyl isomerase
MRLGAAAAALVLAWLGALPSLAAPRQNAAAAPAPSEADWRSPDPQNVLVIDTTKGRVIVEMAPLAAPRSVDQVRALARAGFYDGRAFFRVIDGFMDQTGDPLDNGQGGSTKPNLPAEFTFRRGPQTPFVVIAREGGVEGGFVGSLPVVSQPAELGEMTADHMVNAYGTFCSGVAGMARAEEPDSGNSQFFLMRGPTLSLDGKYTAWGRAIAGLDVIRAIRTGEPVPPPQDTMTRVRVLADIPAAERPSVRVIDPAGPWFRAAAERTRAQKVVGLSLCDLELPVDVH